MVDAEVVKNAAAKLLQSSFSDSPMATEDLVAAIVRELKLKGRDQTRVYPIIREAAKEPDAKFSSRKGRNGGYFRTQPSAGFEATEATVHEPQRALEGAQEKHLWPLIEQWLKDEKKYQYSSAMHANEKSGGKWGNPDVIALNLIDEYGLFAVESATVEVKQALSSWRTWIFEAISHKRFSERVYFAVRTNDPDGSEIVELAGYAEKYGIGLLTIDLSDDDFNSLVSWATLDAQNKAALLDSIRERVSAPFEDVSIKEKIGFLKRLGFKDKNDLVRKVL